MQKRRTVLITGASRGIGRACALKLASENYNVIINYKENDVEARSVYEKVLQINSNAMLIKADISDYYQVSKMFDEIESRYKVVDCLVNNAGIASQKLIQDIDCEHWRKIFSVNVDGVFNCTKRAADAMISQKHGRIVNMASIWGMVGCAMESHYAATKGAIIAFTKSLAKELGYSGITVNAVAPGGVDTDMLAPLGAEIVAEVVSEIPAGRLGRPEEIAEIIAFMLSEKADYINGQVISPNGGFVI